jgi:hypothetical protein
MLPQTQRLQIESIHVRVYWTIRSCASDSVWFMWSVAKRAHQLAMPLALAKSSSISVWFICSVAKRAHQLVISLALQGPSPVPISHRMHIGCHFGADGAVE